MENIGYSSVHNYGLLILKLALRNCFSVEIYFSQGSSFRWKHQLKSAKYNVSFGTINVKVGAVLSDRDSQSVVYSTGQKMALRMFFVVILPQFLWTYMK